MLSLSTIQNEEMMRAYKKLESRYEWAKAQLMELMKATKFDEDLVAQSKFVTRLARSLLTLLSQMTPAWAGDISISYLLYFSQSIFTFYVVILYVYVWRSIICRFRQLYYMYMYAVILYVDVGSYIICRCMPLYDM